MVLTMGQKKVMVKSLSLDRKFHVAFPGDESFEVLDNFAKGLARKFNDRAQTLDLG